MSFWCLKKLNQKRKTNHRYADMPKMKSNRGAAKTFRLTASGKVKRNKAFKSHILTHKSRKRKRALRQSCLVDKADQRRVKLMIQ